jgi:ribonuclease Z
MSEEISLGRLGDQLVQNAPVWRIEHGGLTVEGYSRAAVQTYWRVPQLKVGFDIGAQPWSFMNTPNWFISHCHLDHAVALPVYVARRRMMKMEPPRIYVPRSTESLLEKLLKVWERLDRSRMVCDLIGLEPGQEVELSRELVVTAFATKHTVPALGYLVWERRRKLKEEYLGLPGEQIRDLRVQGKEVTRELRLPLVAFVGDTAPEGLDNYAPVYEAKILIVELTFLAPSHRKDKIHKFGHMHLDDLLERSDRFQNELIIGAHVSTRYHPEKVERLVQKRVPAALRNRLRLCL